MISESTSYDLIAESDGICYRVQVKYARDIGQVGLRRVHSNSTGYVTKKAAFNAYDWLYVVTPDRRQYLRKECLHGRSTVKMLEGERVDTLPSVDED